MDSPGQDLNNEQSGNPQQRVRRASDICVEELAHRFQFWRDHGETTPIADSLAAASRSRQRPDSSRPTAERTATPHVAELESQLEQIQLQLQTNEERRGRVRAELEMHADQHRRRAEMERLHSNSADRVAARTNPFAAASTHSLPVGRAASPANPTTNARILYSTGPPDSATRSTQEDEHSQRREGFRRMQLNMYELARGASNANQSSLSGLSTSSVPHRTSSSAIQDLLMRRPGRHRRWDDRNDRRRSETGQADSSSFMPSSHPRDLWRFADSVYPDFDTESSEQSSQSEAITDDSVSRPGGHITPIPTTPAIYHTGSSLGALFQSPPGQTTSHQNYLSLDDRQPSLERRRRQMLNTLSLRVTRQDEAIRHRAQVRALARAQREDEQAEASLEITSDGDDGGNEDGDDLDDSLGSPPISPPSEGEIEGSVPWLNYEHNVSESSLESLFQRPSWSTPNLHHEERPPGSNITGRTPPEIARLQDGVSGAHIQLERQLDVLQRVERHRVAPETVRMPDSIENSRARLNLERHLEAAGSRFRDPNNYPFVRRAMQARGLSVRTEGIRAPTSLEQHEGRPDPLPMEELKLDCECKICFGQIADTLLLPCAHLVICQWCADQIGARSRSELGRTSGPVRCPMCRACVYDRVKVFRG